MSFLGAMPTLGAVPVLGAVPTFGSGPLTVLADPSVPGNPWFSWRYVQQNSDTILSLLRFHAEITAESMLLSIVVAIPIAVLAYWVRPLSAPIIGISNTLYTIPSLALFAFLVPYTGVGAMTVRLGLVVYALLMIIFNTLTGLQRVPPEVLDAATGMGYGKVGRLLKVELPLALPAIMTGVRLATVSTVALVTVGAVIGQGGLGQLILGGLRNNFYRAEVMTGTLLCVALGFALDLILLGVTRLITPWSRRAVTR